MGLIILVSVSVGTWIGSCILSANEMASILNPLVGKIFRRYPKEAKTCIHVDGQARTGNIIYSFTRQLHLLMIRMMLPRK